MSPSPKPRPQFHITGTERDVALVALIHQAINRYKYEHGSPTKLAALAAMLAVSSPERPDQREGREGRPGVGGL